MTRHIDPIAAHACPGERKLDPRWGLRGCGKHESEGLELGFNLHRYPSFPSSHSSGKQHASRCIEAAGGDPSHTCLPSPFQIISSPSSKPSREHVPPSSSSTPS